MKCEWKSILAKDFIEFNPKITLKKGTITKKVAMDKVLPYKKYINEFEYANYTGGSKFQDGDTIMARITPCLENGKTAFVDFLDENEVGFGSTEFIVLRERKGISDAQYIYYLSISPQFRKIAISSMVGSSGRQRVQQSVLDELELFVPDINEQRRIANILNKIDEKIRINNRINDNLENQVMVLFHHMFGKKNKNRKNIRADEYFDISIGKTPPRKEPQWFSKNPYDYAWVSISDMGNCGLYIGNSSEHLTTDAVKMFNVKIVPDNTVILSFKLTVGRVAITDGSMATNEAIAHFKTDNPKITEYLYCYLKNFNFQTMGSTSSIATAINSKIIKKMSFVVPTDEELEKFHNITAPMFMLIKLTQRENKYMDELRDRFLPKLMSGEVDTSNLDL